jgi:hypothetical protein
MDDVLDGSDGRMGGRMGGWVEGREEREGLGFIRG